MRHDRRVDWPLHLAMRAQPWNANADESQKSKHDSRCAMTRGTRCTRARPPRTDGASRKCSTKNHTIAPGRAPYVPGYISSVRKLKHQGGPVTMKAHDGSLSQPRRLRLSRSRSSPLSAGLRPSPNGRAALLGGACVRAGRRRGSSVSIRACGARPAPGAGTPFAPALDSWPR